MTYRRKIKAGLAIRDITKTRTPSLASKRPSPKEIQRRRALVAQILKHRERCVISPLTTADLVHMARQEKVFYRKQR